MVDRSLIDEVRRRNPIEEIVSMYVSLTRRGNRYVGRCPFHREKTPSFQVSAEKGLFYCFGCQQGGDVIKFLSLRENLSFVDALRTLAARAGLSLDEPDDPAQRRRRAEREEVSCALEQAARYFAAQLRGPAGAAARAYLAERGLSAAALDRYRLGWAADAWDHLTAHLVRQGFSPRTLLLAGLVSPRQHPQGRAARVDVPAVYDRFRARVMFPICDIRGRVVGFGGRALGDAQPKYLNSPETQFFTKGRHLYLLHAAKEAMRAAGEALVVEGYMDAIACHEAGVTHAVASMGTALTADQGRLLLQQVERVVIAYDSDAAGRRATLRGMALLKNEVGCRVHVVRLGEGKDPDEFLRSQGAGAFRRALADAQPFVDYLLDLAYEGVNRTRPGAVSEVTHRMLEALLDFADEVEQVDYLPHIAGRLGVQVKVPQLREALERLRRARGGKSGRSALLDKGGKSWHATTGSSRPSPVDRLLGPLPLERRAARNLVACMLQDPGVTEVVRAEVPLDWFDEPRLRRIAELLLQGLWPPVGGEEPPPDEAAGAEAPVRPPRPGEPDLSPEHLQNLAAAIVMQGPTAGAGTGGAEGDPMMRSAADCIHILRAHKMMSRMSELRRQIYEHEQSGRAIPMDLLKEYQELARKSKGT